MQEEELLKQQANSNRQQYQSNSSNTNPQELAAAKYLSYDPQTRLAKLQDTQGSIFYGKADTNGAIARGEDVRLRRGYGLPGYDSMPHVTPQLPGEEKITKTVIATDLLYYLETQKNEDVAPNISGEWTFYGGRCRPLTSFYGGVERYASQEECIASNSIITSVGIAYNASSGNDWTFTTEDDYTGVNISFNNPPRNLLGWVIFDFSIETYSSFSSTLTINCDFTSSGADYTEWIVSPAGIPNPRQVGNHFALTLSPNLGLSFTTERNLGGNVEGLTSRIYVGLLLSFERLSGDSPYLPLSASGRLEVVWKPLPEKVPIGDFYLRRQQNAQIQNVPLGEVSLTRGLQCFISQTPKKAFVSFLQYSELDENEVLKYRFLQRFTVEQKEAAMILYENPELPVEDSDWLQLVYSYELSLLTPENIRAALGLSGLCLQLPLYIQNFNFYKGAFYKLDLYEQQGGTQIQELLRTEPVTVQAKVIPISLDTEKNACSIIKETPKTLRLLPIGDEKARIVSASFLIVKKYARS